MGFGTPGSSAVGDTAAAGTSQHVPRLDHRHAREAFATTSDIADITATEAAGSAATVPRGDHVHALPSLAAWTTWTPSWTNLTTGNGTTNAGYQVFGKLVVCELEFTFGSTSSITGSVSLAVPFGTPRRTTRGGGRVDGEFFDSSASQRWGLWAEMGGGLILLAMSATPGLFTNLNATTPFAFGTNDVLTLSGMYETT